MKKQGFQISFRQNQQTLNIANCLSNTSVQYGRTAVQGSREKAVQEGEKKTFLIEGALICFVNLRTRVHLIRYLVSNDILIQQSTR